MNFKYQVLIAVSFSAIVFISQPGLAQSKKTAAVKYASAKEAIYALIDTASKSEINTNAWLANTIAANPAIKAGLNEWMNIFGEGLTSVKPWIIPIPGEAKQGAAVSNTTNASLKPLSAELISASGSNPPLNLYFTTKNGAVYVIVKGAMRDMQIRSLAISNVVKPMDAIKMLGSSERISWEQQERALTLEKPEALASQDAVVFKITFQEYYNSPGTEH